MARPVYVEILIKAPLDELWERTQEPEQHRRWDLRFSSIEYLSRSDPSEPQQFLYTTRIGFGLSIAGTGSSAGSRDGPGNRTSALQFGSEDPKSLIREGSGYWKYEQLNGRVRFLTRYGYDVRFGRAGRWFDALVFRPMIGWATAWSFDRLRLWLEKHIDPAVSMRDSVIHAVVRLSLALVWIYHGLVPKLLYPESGELELLQQTGMFTGRETTALTMIGLGEMTLGLLTILLWHHRWVFPATIALLLALAAGAAVGDPGVFQEPFSPATLTIALVALASIGYLISRDLPSSRNCRRTATGADE